jgi:hypothetical protein
MPARSSSVQAYLRQTRAGALVGAGAFVAALVRTSYDEDVTLERLVAITQLAERLDRRTLDLAERLVPHEWWTERLSPRTPWPATSRRKSGLRDGTP